MKKFRHPRRSVILLLLLSPLTLGIYPLVVYCHVGKEINRINEGKEGYKKSMHFIGALLLGIITLGIVPLVWMCRVAGKIGRAAIEHKIVKPKVSALSFFVLFFLFSWTFICPLIALCKFFHTLNKLEQAINAEIDQAAAEEAQATIIPVPEEAAPEGEAAPEAEAAPEGEPAPEEVAEEAKPEGEPVPEEPAPEAEPAPEEPLPFEHVTELDPGEINKEEARSEIASVYHVADRQDIRKWRVRIPGSETAVKIFDTREEALAYAKGLAARKHATVRVKRS